MMEGVYQSLMLLLCSTCLCHGLNGTGLVDLYKDKIENYIPGIRPVLDTDLAVQVSLAVDIKQIYELDDRKQTLTGIYWISLDWYDPFLTWNPEDYGNVTSMTVKADSIWTPDITLFNDVGESRREVEALFPLTVNNDRVLWSFPTMHRSSCPLDMTYFPWDEQHCGLQFSSWAYPMAMLNLSALWLPAILPSHFIPDGQWDVYDVSMERQEIQYGSVYSEMRYTVHMRRKPLYYMFNIIIPCVLIAFCGMLVFALPADSGEKVGLSVTILLALTVFQLIIAEIMPPISDQMPIVGIYFTGMLALLVGSTMCTVFVLMMHHRGERGLPVPRMLRVIIVDGLGTVLYLRPNVTSIRDTNENSGNIVAPARESLDPKDIEGPVKFPSDGPAEPADIGREWKLIAIVLDRAFFIAYVIVIVAFTIFLFV